MKDELKIIIDYVEGRLDINDVKMLIINDKHLQKMLKKPFDYKRIAYARYHFNIYEYLSSECHFDRNWDTVDTRCVVYLEFTRLLDFKKIKYNKDFTKYVDDYDYMLRIQPSWLDIIDDQGIFDKIIAEAPADVSKTKRIAWGKARLKELFRYDKTYPRWVQSPEWPIVNGKPLVFSHQSKEKKDDERVFYYFYDPDTKEETVVEQMY